MGTGILSGRAASHSIFLRVRRVVFGARRARPRAYSGMASTWRVTASSRMETPEFDGNDGRRAPRASEPESARADRR